ncbi:hypothetical protein H8697_00900 [[Eubacterium] tenue]|nr:hypothetical protein [[Eubacterium] tenue]MBC8630268.1 hypothetical protein [[Eubacterium] tenue]
MRFDTLAKVYELSKRSDGQGGYIENKSFNKSIYCNKSSIRIEKQIQIFGVVNYESISIITMDEINLKNFCISINGIYYKPVSKPKRVRNKTYITLDVLENAN